MKQKEMVEINVKLVLYRKELLNEFIGEGGICHRSI